MSDPASATLPPGRSIRQRLSRDDIMMRSWMIVIALYLVVTLVFPLYAMLSKSTSTYNFDLAQYEFQVSDETGSFNAPPRIASALNAALDAPLEGANLSTSSDGRLPATTLFPDFSFRSPVMYRMRGTEEQARYLVGSTLHTGTEWTELSSNDFRRVMLRPKTARGLENFVTYFSTPALFRSLQNSLVIALISTVITVSLAFGFAYALNRSCMRFKGLFRLIAMAPILVPSLLPGIALVYLFGNQGMLKELLFGASIYGPIGIVIGSVFFIFPHAFLIISTALAISDARLYEAAQSLKTSAWKMVVAGVLLLALSARIQVPMWPVPMTLQPFAVLLIGLTYGSTLGAATVVAYLAAGFVGLPVFAAGGGPAYFAGPTAGFLLGFVPAAWFAGRMAEKGWDRSVGSAFIAGILALTFIYLVGVPWLAGFLSIAKGLEPLHAANVAVAKGMIPFAFGDLVKAGLAAAILPVAWKFLGR